MADKDSPSQKEEQSKESPREKKKNEKREKLSESGQIDVLRERLYARGEKPVERERHSLKDESYVQEIAEKQEVKEAITPLAEKSAPKEKNTVISEGIKSMAAKLAKKKKGYRLKIVLAALVFFVLALGLSSMFLFYGGNTISAENITIDISDPPLAVGGGEEITMQISIANQNAIPIESSTLIVKYPPGTQSAGEPRREIFSERLPLNSIDAGEAVNVPIKAVFFGEENDEKIVDVSIEYRVQGSNATFFKEALPWRFKITSSPVVLEVDTLKSISSGQMGTFELTLRSNAPTTLNDILIKAAYPPQFEFVESDPKTVSGQDTWFIEELEPEEEAKITFKGIVVGKQNEERIFTFSAGVANERDRFSLASMYTSASAEIDIEEPFLGVNVFVNRSDDNAVNIEVGDSASVRIDFTNTLEDTLYDGKITAKLSGNALNEVKVRVNDDGFYDSSTNMITWDFVDVSDLKETLPGQTNSLNFSLEPERDIGRTPEIRLDVTAKAQRVFEDRVPQELVGIATRSIRIASAASLSSSAIYSEGPFVNSGPVPPVAEEVTQYTFLFQVRNGSNDITGAEMTATMPSYVTWLDLVTPGDDISYNSTSRTLKWNIGDMDANEYEEAWVQVSFLPSLSQVDTTPTLLETQRFRATDRFTGTTLRVDASPLTTALINDPNEEARDGRVQRN